MAREAPRAARGRLGLALAFLALALLLATAAAWGAGRLRERSAADAADARLASALRAASAEVSAELEDAAARARILAASAPVQRAFLRRDRAALARLAERIPTVTFELPGGRPVGAEASALQRAVEVMDDGRVLGRVVVGVPVDEELVARLETAGGVPPGDELAIARGAEFVTPVPDDGERRSLSAALARGSALRLVASAPAHPIADAAADMRRRVFLAALLTLALLGLSWWLIAHAV